MRSRFLPQRFANGPHCVFGRGINTHRRKDFDSCSRNDVDNVARLLTLEHGQRGRDAVKRAAQIDVDHGVPIFYPQRIETGYRPDPGVVHDDV